MPSPAVGPTSIRLPKLVLLVTTAVKLEVPTSRILPLTKGLVLTGRTRTFCQVSELVFGLLLLLLTVKVICVVVTEDTGALLPLAALLMFLLVFPLPPSTSILTVGL